MTSSNKKSHGQREKTFKSLIHANIPRIYANTIGDIRGKLAIISDTMGIRKHFEKKPDEDLKLQDLTLEQESAPELKFDPETEITEAAWQGMKDKLESHRNNSWWSFAYQAMRLKILFPSRTAELDLNDSAWQGMKGQLESDRQDNNWWDFADQAMLLKVLFPERVSELDLNGSTWQGIKDQLEYYHQSNDWRDFIAQAKNLKILFPDRVSELNLNDSAWQGMKDALESCSQNTNWWDFTGQAMNLKILAADKVETTDQGLKITMLPPESFKSEKKPRPERKQF